MKHLAILFAALCTIGMMASESQAQRHGGHGGHGHHGGSSRSGFAISIGNGYSGFSYSNFQGGRNAYGGYYGRPVYHHHHHHRYPSYGYGGYYGRPVIRTGVGIYGGYGGFGCGW